MERALALAAVAACAVALVSRSAPGAEEFRGVYMELHSNRAFGCFPIVQDGDWRRLCRELKGFGVNAILPNVVSPAGAIYPSKVVATKSASARQNRPDLLKVIVEAAHAEGLEVHPWTIEWYKSPKGTPAERLVKDVNGKTHNTLCASVEANRKLMREMILELVTNYDIDGVQYDYMRLPGKQYCYCRSCRAGFEKKRGRAVAGWPGEVTAGGALESEYSAYLCGNISRFIEEMYPLIKKAKPKMVVSCAVWVAGRDGKRAGNPGVRQDWGLWVEKGWLDFIAPMVYGNKWIVDRFDEFGKAQAKHVVGRMPLVYGLGAYQDTPAHQVASVRSGRKLGGSGFIVYTLTERIYREHLPALGRDVWKDPAKVPAFGRK